MKSLRSIRRENDSAARRSRRSSRVWVPRVGWLSLPQQRALREIHFHGEGTAWTIAPAGIHHATLSSLERLGLLEYGHGVRLTGEGADVVRRWQEADDR